MKRVFSLVVAGIMLLTLSVTGVSAAAEFADAGEITYTEAVTAAAEKGLFAGSDGKFNPKGTVTRAQMATVMVKMLLGSDFNADAYKGEANPFVDTADYQGGWAEGYINACFQLGVVSGYGEGKFGPDDPVTAAQAVTMIIKALKIETEDGPWVNWYDSFMSKAEELGLFGVITPKPGAEEPMVREQLAVIVMQGVDQMNGENDKQDEPAGPETPEQPSSGNESTGGETTGSETTGNEPTGGETTGNEPTGGETTDNTPSGDESVSGDSSVTGGTEQDDEDYVYGPNETPIG